MVSSHFTREFVVATAKPAEPLSLPTEPVKAILQAHYKDETRKLINNSNVQLFRMGSAERLEDLSVTAM